MVNDVFNIENFNIISDDNNYYFFRALNNGDNNDIKNGITIDNNGNIVRIRTDRERYEGNPNYTEDDKLTLQEIFDHIKIHHRTDTNCISLTTNANVAILYGREHYNDKYVMVKVPKKDLGKNVVNAGLYMMDKIIKNINTLVEENKLSEELKFYLQAIDLTQNEQELNKIIKDIMKEEQDITDNMFEKGITYTPANTTTIDYQVLTKKQNFEKNKIIAKLNILGQNILSNSSNKFLIQTIGNAFSSLEFIHYKNIEKEELIEIPSEIIDIFSLLQQLPKDYPKVQELKQKLINIITKKTFNIKKFRYINYELDIENDYTIEKMYNLTNGNIDYYSAINLYKKSFYLAKTKLRTKSMVNLLNVITNYNPEYKDILKELETKTYGVEPKIFSKTNSNKLKVSESVNLDFNKKEKELFDFINSLSSNELNYILNNPLDALKNYLNEFKNREYNQLSKEEYYANAIIDLFDWEKIGVVKFNQKRRNDLINKLKENHILELYNFLKQNNIKEKEIANALLTIIIKEKDLKTIDLDETFTAEELDNFLGYYKIKGTKKLKLRHPQVSALRNINTSFKRYQFTAAILPTGLGKSFIALAKMLENREQEILYLAPNDVILNQIEDYIIEYIIGDTTTKNKKDLIKEVFPNLKLRTYQSLLSHGANKIINHKYDLIIFDEFHRSKAKKWEKQILKLLENQDKNTKILGITATPQRDVDLINVADEWARYFDYTEEEIAQKKHIAVNMDLEDAIKLGYVVHPKIVSCEYTLLNEFDSLNKKINDILDENKKTKLKNKLNVLRKKIEQADDIDKILGDNLKLGGRYIVFCPVINSKGKLVEDEDGFINDTRGRITGKDVIEKYTNELKKQLKKYHNISDEKIDSMLEFYSMLGEYSTSKNENNLKKFEINNPNKIKFMVVMNKLNEGSHVKNDGLIWFRALDENSKILFYQQFGRIIYSIPSNKNIEDDKRPIAIDLPCNTFTTKLNKRTQKTDLENLKNIEDWIIQRNGQIPDLNSSNKVESIYGNKLKYLQEKYIVYTTNKELITKLNKKTKAEITEILNIGNNIDLWTYIFDEKIKTNSKKIYKFEEKVDIFSITAIMKDFYEIVDELDELLIMSPEEKKNELIKTIHELKRLPKKKKPHHLDVERKFKDGTNQRTFFDNIQLKYNKIKLDKQLTTDEQQVIKDYEEIIEVLNQYNIFISNKTKKNELIKTIHELKRLPKRIEHNEKISEKKFEDGTDQRAYFDSLQTKYKKIILKNNLSIDEQQIIKDYEEIISVLKQFNKYLTEDEKNKELIKTIHELKRLPKVKMNHVSEKVFEDGTDQRGYFEHIQKKYKRINLNGVLTKKEIKIKNTYEEIIKVINQYSISMTSEEKKMELIKTIHELKRLPKVRRNNISEKVFEDETDQRSYYENLKKKYKKLDFNKDLTKEEKEIKTMYEEILEVINQYSNIIITQEEKINELIKTIHKLKRLPKRIEHNGGTREKSFTDGTDQRSYYENLKTKYKKIIKKDNLSTEEQQILKDYEKLKNEIDKLKEENTKKLNELCSKYNITIDRSIINKSYEEIYAKICYLNNKKIPIKTNNKLHEIFFMSDLNMQIKYAVSLDDLIEQYINESIRGKKYVYR